MSTRNAFVLRLASGTTVHLKEGVTLRADDLLDLKTTSADGVFAEVNRNPTDPTILGLKNLSQQTWTATLADGSQRQVESSKSIRLTNGTTINLGPVVSAVRERTSGFALELASGFTVSLKVGQKITTSDLLSMGGKGPVAEVSRNPNDPTILGLKNLTSQTWSVTGSGARIVPPGKSIRLATGTTINFGSVKGEIQEDTAATLSTLIGQWRPAVRISKRTAAVMACLLGAFVVVVFYMQSGDEASNPGELTFSEEFVRERSQPRSITVGREGGTLSLDDGATITVPGDAFDRTTRLRASIVHLVPSRISSDIQRVWVYEVSTDEDFSTLGKPVVLEVPQSADGVIVTIRDKGIWRRLDIPPGSTTKIEISHFSFVYIGIAIAAAAYAAEKMFDISGSLLAALEGGAARKARQDRAIAEVDSDDPVSRDRRKVEQAYPMTRAFFGVSEKARKSTRELCDEFKEVLREFSGRKENLAFPEQPESRWGWLSARIKRSTIGDGSTAQNDLPIFLQEAVAPKNQGGDFYKSVEPSMDEIRVALLSQTDQVSPAQFLRIAIKANGDNVPLGMLAAHNYLKNITYLGRDSYASNRNMTEYGESASKLQSWRQDDNIKPSAGIYDKMGPIYHLFAGMTAAYWLPSFLGENVDKAEGALRALKIGADLPDKEQSLADRCGIQIGSWAYSGMAKIQKTEQIPIEQQPGKHWDEPFNVPQYLLHFRGTGTYADGTPQADQYILFPAKPDENGNVLFPDGSGGTHTRKPDSAKGPFTTPREVCQATGGMPRQSLKAWNSWYPFDCAELQGPPA